MNPTNNAFRFAVGANAYALDIADDLARLYVERRDGWQIAPEFSPLSASAEAINAIGGPVKFAQLLIAAVNSVLRIIQGKPREGDIAKPKDDGPQSEVLAYLKSSVVAYTMMDGVVQLRVK